MTNKRSVVPKIFAMLFTTLNKKESLSSQIALSQDTIANIREKEKEKRKRGKKERKKRKRKKEKKREGFLLFQSSSKVTASVELILTHVHFALSLLLSLPFFLYSEKRLFFAFFSSSVVEREK